MKKTNTKNKDAGTSNEPLSAEDAIIAMVRDGENLSDRNSRKFYWGDGSKVF
jgi:hypothetical protein